MVDTLLLFRGVMVAAGIALLSFAVWLDGRHESPGLRPFAVLVGTLGFLATVDGAVAGDLVLLSLVWLTALIAIPLAFTWFVVEYYGLPYLASIPRKVAFVAPAVVGVAGGWALILSPNATGSMSGAASAPAMPQPLGLAVLAEQIGIFYAGGVMLVGVGLLVRTVARYDHLDWKLGAVFSLVAVWPWLAYFSTPGVFGMLPLETIFGMTTSGYVVSAGAVAFAVTRGGIFDAAPAAGTLGPQTVLSELEDAVLAIDQEERIVQANPAARRRFGLEDGAVTGQPIESALGVDMAELRSPEPIELGVDGGTRQFEASVSPVTDRWGRQPGEAVVLTDVTRQQVRSQRLSVLNRVLRHNLRNEMNHIIGRAELIAAEDSEYEETAEIILSSADDLVKTSERAREVEEVMSGAPDLESPTPVARVAQLVVADYAEDYPDASLSVDIDEALTVTADRTILTRVLENLVENALVHNDAPTPVVTVSARIVEGGEAVRLSVADNGPGIPEQERSVIESGSENPLEHGSGLGLWAVKWGVVRLGGELTFADNEPEGTVVSLRLPPAGAPQVGQAVAVEAA